MKKVDKTRITIPEIKSKVEKYQGNKVQIEAHKSKKKLYRKTGYIDSIYPHIFTVRLEDDNPDPKRRPQLMSFSYVDILTKNVKIDVIDAVEGEAIPL